MSTNSIPNEIALRIGLAARELPETDAARLLKVLNDAVGLPPTLQKLSGLSVKSLRAAAHGELSDMDTEVLKSALSFLKGESGVSADPLPQAQPYSEGDMPNSIRVACASNKGEMLDGHFGSCRRFLIYQVSADAYRLVDIRSTEEDSKAEDKNAYRASLVADSQIVLVCSIGGPAAAKVVKTGAHPIKKPNACPALEEIQALQQVIGKDAPPWLAKVMGQTPEERIRFEQEAGA
jgi:nitrogen fixation protein NifX